MPTSKITTQVLYEKESDDWIEIITIPADAVVGDISAYSDFECDLMDDAVLTAPVTSAVATAGVTVYNNSSRQLKLDVSKNQTSQIVESTKTLRKLYSDVRATDSLGDEKTLVQLQWIITRKWSVT